MKREIKRGIQRGISVRGGERREDTTVMTIFPSFFFFFFIIRISRQITTYLRKARFATIFQAQRSQIPQIPDRYTFHDEYRGVTSTRALASWEQGSSRLEQSGDGGRKMGTDNVQSPSALFSQFSHQLARGTPVRVSTPTHDAKKFPFDSTWLPKLPIVLSHSFCGSST